MSIVAGMLFSLLWISTGMEQVVCARVVTFLVAGGVAGSATLMVPPNGLRPGSTAFRDEAGEDYRVFQRHRNRRSQKLYRGTGRRE